MSLVTLAPLMRDKPGKRKYVGLESHYDSHQSRERNAVEEHVAQDVALVSVPFGRRTGDDDALRIDHFELFFSSPSKQGVTLDQLINKRRPAVEFIKGKLAAKMGGKPDDYTLTTLALWALLHGTAMLLTAKTVQPDYATEMRAACRAALQTILRDARNISLAGGQET